MRNCKKWTKGEIALIAKLRESGEPYSAIACKMGVTKAQVISVARNYGIGGSRGEHANEKWRVKQLLTAGYSSRDAARMIGCSPVIAQDVFDEIYD